MSWSVHFMDWIDPIFVYPTDTNIEHFVLDENYNKLYQKMQDGNLDTFTYLIPRGLDLS
jgi:hypothetical protein